jgi:hypothetical protein
VRKILYVISRRLAFGAAGLKYRAGLFNQQVATRVGQMLASEDPMIFQKGVAAVARSRPMMEALRNAGAIPHWSRQ